MTNEVDHSMPEESVCRMEDNVLDTGTIPIIFVPGVMGSRITFSGGTWDPDSDTNMVGWAGTPAGWAFDNLRVHSGNRGTVLEQSDSYTQWQRTRGWAGISNRFYGQFLRDLDNRRFGRYHTPVYGVGYDWRQSNRASGRYLARKVQGVLGHEGVDRYILVSHSMGGLVTRSFLKDHETLRDQCLGIIHIAQPVHGGVVLVRRLFTGAGMEHDGGYSLEGFVFTRIAGTSRKSAITVAAGMPGPLQLLVTQNYRDSPRAGHPSGWYDYKTFEEPDRAYRTWSGNIWNLYQSEQSPPGLLPPANQGYSPNATVRSTFTTNLQTAQRFHNWLGVWKYTDKTWSIYGTGRRVDTRVPFHLPPREYHVDTMSAVVAGLGAGFGVGGPIMYRAERANGESVLLTDPNPEGRGLQITQTPHSDGTVPKNSAQGLFPGEAHPVARGSNYDERHQFEIDDPTHPFAGHDAICKHPQCETATFDIIEHILGI